MFNNPVTWAQKMEAENKWWVKYCYTLKAEADRRYPDDDGSANALFNRWRETALRNFWRVPE